MIWLLYGALAVASGREVQINVQDPQRQVAGALRVAIQGSEGTNQVVHLKDDGADPDHTPSDGIFTGRAQFSDSTVHLEIGSEQRKWTADAVLPDPGKDTVLRLQLGPEETAVVLQGARGMLGGPGPAGTPSDGLWLWAILIGGLGVGLGLGARWMLARPPEAARLDAVNDAAKIPTQRFAAHALPEVLVQLSEHLVIFVGEPPQDAQVARCLDARVRPETLIRAIEHASLGSTRTPVLVVADVDALELPMRKSAQDALERVLQGRIALWLVQSA